jgi:lipopolysaccharide/colanic/teichoic acid biosynthesis glycosyltransferase
MVAVGLIRLYISNRQLKMYKHRTMDMQVGEIFEQAEFESSQEYNQEKQTFGMFESCFDLVLSFFIWYFFVPAWAWNQVNKNMASLGWCQQVAYKNDSL